MIPLKWKFLNKPKNPHPVKQENENKNKDWQGTYWEGHQ